MSLNNNYTYPIMVSITSILLNSNKNTFNQFHILIGNDIEIQNKNKILSLKNINNNTNFSFYNVGNNNNSFLVLVSHYKIFSSFRFHIFHCKSSTNKKIKTIPPTIENQDFSTFII
jgi:lipopolysaccharide biosynthesis glycosyltransferase